MEAPVDRTGRDGGEVGQVARLEVDDLPVTYQALVPREEIRHEGTARRVSFSGVVVSTDDLPPLGAVIELRLHLPDRPMRLFAEIKWLEPAVEGQGRFGAFFLLPTTGRMLDLLDLHLSRRAQ